MRQLLYSYLLTCSKQALVYIFVLPISHQWNPENSGSGEVTSYSVCDVEADPPNTNWLRSDIIRVDKAKRLNVSIMFNIRNCSSFESAPKNCREGFDLYAFQTDQDYQSQNEWPEPGRNWTFQKIGTYRSVQKSDSERDQNYSAGSLSVLVRGKHVFIAFLDNGACIHLHSLVVSYNVCPEKTLDTNLVTLPRTVALANASLVQKVKGSCLKDSVPTSEDLYGFCPSSGEWKSGIKHHGKCRCNAGFTKVGARCKGKFSHN